jgi:hypothetical protein
VIQITMANRLPFCFPYAIDFEPAAESHRRSTRRPRHPSLATLLVWLRRSPKIWPSAITFYRSPGIGR